MKEKSQLKVSSEYEIQTKHDDDDDVVELKTGPSNLSISFYF